MKFNKWILAIAAVAAFTLTAAAQQSGVNVLINGGAYRVLAGTTNVVANGTTSTNTYGLPGTGTNLAQVVSQFDYVGLTWYNGAGSNSTLKVFGSTDNGTIYGNNPIFSYATPAATSGVWKTNPVIDVHGYTHIAFVIENPGTVDLTNQTLKVNLKQPKVWQLPARN